MGVKNQPREFPGAEPNNKSGAKSKSKTGEVSATRITQVRKNLGPLSLIFSKVEQGAKENLTDFSSFEPD